MIARHMLFNSYRIWDTHVSVIYCWNCSFILEIALTASVGIQESYRFGPYWLLLAAGSADLPLLFDEPRFELKVAFLRISESVISW